MKIICLTRYSYKGASSRYRFYNLKYLFENKNILFEIKPLLNDVYLSNLYVKKKKNIINIFSSYLFRFFIFFSLRNYDKIIIEKELLPFVPYLEYPLFRIYKSKIYLDYDDYVFDNYNFKSIVLKKIFKNKFKYILRNSKGVITGNKYLKNYVKKFNNNVIEIPTLIDTKKFKSTIQKKYSIVSIVWIGTPTTIQYLENIMPILNTLYETYKFCLIVIGGKLKNNCKFVKYYKWSEETENDILQSSHIGIMPLNNSTWSKGKCGLKILQYMASKLPVVVSNIGANKDIVDHNLDGYLVADEKQWIEYLTKLINSNSLREKLGNNGYEKVFKKYSHSNNFNKYLDFLGINEGS